MRIVLLLLLFTMIFIYLFIYFLYFLPNQFFQQKKLFLRSTVNQEAFSERRSLISGVVQG